MIQVPAHGLGDIFTEPADVDPDTLANLGPLRRLAGSWRAPRGMDVSPKAVGPERRQFIEAIDFQPIDPQTNGPQLLYGLRYHIHITTVVEDITFHDQVGYWLWEPATGSILQTVALPRGLVALAGGQAKPDADRIIVTSRRGDDCNGVSANSFLDRAFRTESYCLTIDVHGEDSWSYLTETELLVQGQGAPFVHEDRNTLIRVGPPKPNPWAAIIASRKKANSTS